VNVEPRMFVPKRTGVIQALQWTDKAADMWAILCWLEKFKEPWRLVPHLETDIALEIERETIQPGDWVMKGSDGFGRIEKNQIALNYNEVNPDDQC
jgi:hypothetical protein